MLFQIQQELSAHKKNAKLLSSVERDISIYKKLKKEYEKLPTSTQKQLTPQFLVYLFNSSDSFFSTQYRNDKARNKWAWI